MYTYLFVTPNACFFYNNDLTCSIVSKFLDVKSTTRLILVKAAQSLLHPEMLTRDKIPSGATVHPLASDA